jgi:hypothetical protein
MSGGYCATHGYYQPTTAGHCPQCGSHARLVERTSQLSEFKVHVCSPSLGWACPRCEHVWAPTVRECQHCLSVLSGRPAGEEPHP